MKNAILRKSLVGLVALAAGGIATQTMAEGNWYVGASASQAFVDERGLDEDDTGGQIFGGYKFNDYFAVEGGYYDFGEIEEGNSQLEIDGVSLAVVGSIPVTSNVSLFGKAGAHDWDAGSSGSIASQLDTDGDTDAFYGIGVDLGISDSWSVRGELDRYEVDDLDVDVVSIGVSFTF